MGALTFRAARRSAVGAVLLIVVVGCAGPVPPPSADPRPWTVHQIDIGRYADLWRGSANDPGGDPQRPPDRIVWRIDLMGPDGDEELYLDSATYDLVDAITQGQ